MSRYGTYDLKQGFIPDDDCPKQETPKQTNGDRLRAKTNEELAVWIVDKTEGNDFDEYKDHVESWLDWLKLEVDDDE